MKPTWSIVFAYVGIWQIRENINYPSRSIRFKWRAAQCSEEYNQVCEIRTPNCPKDYTWFPGVGQSCFKVVEATYEHTDGSKWAKLFNYLGISHEKFRSRHAPVQNFDAKCAKDGTRLAVPYDEEETQAMIDWLLTQSPWIDGQTDVIKINLKLFNNLLFFVWFQVQFYLGLRQKNVNLTILAREWHPANFAHFPTYADNENTNPCRTLSADTTDGLMTDVSCAPTSGDFRGLCQYMACTSVTGVPCVFPFKYKGRTYNTCVRLERSEEPWCSTLTDTLGDHVPGTEATCPEHCLWTNCPVGFYRAEPDHTCVQVLINY